MSTKKATKTTVSISYIGMERFCRRLRSSSAQAAAVSISYIGMERVLDKRMLGNRREPYQSLI